MNALLAEAIQLGFRDVAALPNVKVDLKYASADNFLAENIYGDFNRALLHPEAYLQFARATQKLGELRRGWSFVVFDALRPRSMQRKLFEKVFGTPEEIYVMNPDLGSVHNYGFAIDLSCLDETGLEVDMGSGFDAFVKLSHPALEAEFLASGALSSEQVANRDVLRGAMAAGGFTGISHEWWHFNGHPTDYVRRHYPIFE